MPSSRDENLDDHRNEPPRPRPTGLPSLGVVAVLIATAIYGFWHKGNPGAAPQPRGAANGRVENDRSAEAHSGPTITPERPAPESDPSSSRPQASTSGDIEIIPAKRTANPQTKPQPPPTAVDRTRPALIPQVTLKDQDGDVIYEGPIDLQPTLDRIAKGQRNTHRNDGSVFQNREGRLARKPSGYYHEYVVPTPNQGGPGPQRLIMGKGGEVFYTADHYRSFRKIDVRVVVP